MRKRRTTKEPVLTKLDYWAIAANEVYKVCRKNGMDESNNTPDVVDRNQLIGQIYIQPTKTAEFVILDFTILPTGVQFPA